MAEDGDSGKSSNSISISQVCKTENSRKDPEKSPSVTLESKENDKTIFRCDNCEKFETCSHPLFLVHAVQCVATVSKQEGDDGDSNEPSTVSENEKAPQSSRKLFECDVCNMKFSNGANMRRHKMRHTGVKPYECRVCQKRFFRKDHLAEHFTTHTKTLPYHCPICNRGFQRQIAMRAHFQNEHVGQHDLVKTCPLCSYRAGTMKSLRVHFFNRHGIDLDNPGSAAPSSLMLALDPQRAGQFHQSLCSTTTTTGITASYSDSGESLRSTENATPPMHFLTPHVEISMADNNEQFNIAMDGSKSNDAKPVHGSNEGSSSHQSTDFLNHVPSSSQKIITLATFSHNSHIEGHITPSISLIPIKQEQNGNEEFADSKNTDEETVINTASDGITSNNNLTSLIKVSPLKSLLREDLKRRICARANSRAARALHNGNNNEPIPASDTNISDATSLNGSIISSGHEIDILPTNRKHFLQCLFCRIEFPDQTLYFLHKGCHSDSNPWKCNICGEQCNNVYEFNSHLLSKSHQ